MKKGKKWSFWTKKTLLFSGIFRSGIGGYPLPPKWKITCSKTLSGNGGYPQPPLNGKNPQAQAIKQQWTAQKHGNDYIEVEEAFQEQTTGNVYVCNWSVGKTFLLYFVSSVLWLNSFYIVEIFRTWGIRCEWSTGYSRKQKKEKYSKATWNKIWKIEWVWSHLPWSRRLF